jgi:hypothetical protein
MRNKLKDTDLALIREEVEEAYLDVDLSKEGIELEEYLGEVDQWMAYEESWEEEKHYWIPYYQQVFREKTCRCKVGYSVVIREPDDSRRFIERCDTCEKYRSDVEAWEVATNDGFVLGDNGQVISRPPKAT